MQTVTNVYEILHASPCDCFQFLLSAKSLVHIRKRDKEPSRIPVINLFDFDEQ